MEGDSLTLRDLELWTRIGITEQERSAPQRVLLTVELPVDGASAAAADTPSVDYAAVRATLLALAGTERKTIERLGDDAAAALLAGYSLPRVVIEIRKFPFKDAKEAVLRITRTAQR